MLYLLKDAAICPTWLSIVRASFMGTCCHLLWQSPHTLSCEVPSLMYRDEAPRSLCWALPQSQVSAFRNKYAMTTVTTAKQWVPGNCNRTWQRATAQVAPKTKLAQALLTCRVGCGHVTSLTTALPHLAHSWALSKAHTQQKPTT